MNDDLVEHYHITIREGATLYQDGRAFGALKRPLDLYAEYNADLQVYGFNHQLGRKPDGTLAYWRVTVREQDAEATVPEGYEILAIGDPSGSATRWYISSTAFGDVPPDDYREAEVMFTNSETGDTFPSFEAAARQVQIEARQHAVWEASWEDQ